MRHDGEMLKRKIGKCSISHLILQFTGKRKVKHSIKLKAQSAQED